MSAVAITMGGVNPTVEPPSKIVNDGMGIVRAQAGVELAHGFGFAIAVGVANQPNVGGRRSNDAIFIKDKAGDQFEPFVEDLFLIGTPIAVCINENRNAVGGGTLLRVGSSNERSGIFPGLDGRAFAPAGIFRCFGNPETALGVPIDTDWLADERFGRDQANVEVRVNLE